MTFLGIGDGPSSGAALVVDGSIACVAPEHGAQGLPAKAIAAVLEDAGAKATDVDVVALAGRFTTPLVARRFPVLGEMSGTIAWRRASAFWQTALRTTGLGALQADRAATWVATALEPLGFGPRRHRTVDLHTCLASAAYRCQEWDVAVVVTVEPHGDGLLAAVHHGLAGHLERMWDQAAEPALHTHLDRCARALRLPVPSAVAAFVGLADGAEPDVMLMDLVGPRVTEGRLTGGLAAEGGARLAEGPREIGAASVVAALRRAMVAFVGAHVPAGATLAVAGAWLAEPGTVTALADLDVARIACGPDLDGATAALGAALHEVGTPPAPVPATLGPRHAEAALRDVVLEVGYAEVRDGTDRAARALAGGAVLGRIAGRSGNGTLGTRSVLVRGGDPAALERARAVAVALGASRMFVALPAGGERLAPAFAHGMAEHEGRTRVVTRSDDPALAALVDAVPGGLLALPLADDPRAAVGHHRAGRLDGVLLGPFQVLAA